MMLRQRQPVPDGIIDVQAAARVFAKVADEVLLFRCEITAETGEAGVHAVTRAHGTAKRPAGAVPLELRIPRALEQPVLQLLPGFDRDAQLSLRA